MPGGLLQIVSYGSQDLFLTGNPEITFFKVVYRRHTNFSMESREVNFEDTVGFGKESTLIFPKIGDLIHKLYLKIKVPSINLLRRVPATDPSDTTYYATELAAYNTAKDNFSRMRKFMVLNLEGYRRAVDQWELTNVSDAQDLMDEIAAIHDTILENDYESLVGNENYMKTSMFDVQNGFSPATGEGSKDLLKAELDKAYQESIILHKEYSDALLAAETALEDAQSDNIKFAWIDRLGHSIIDYMEVSIGGYCIDKHLGLWLDIWYELAGNKYQNENYMKMIGDVAAMTTFDRTIKGEYTMYIPLQFWFCRRTGLAFPLIALEHQDFAFRIKLRKLEEVSYVENGVDIVFDANNTLFLDEITEEYDLQIEMSLLVDYIYLDKEERRLFAQSSHEYLIEQVQETIFRDLRSTEASFLLDYYHPCKEMIWVTQKNAYRENSTGFNKSQWTNYALSDDKTGNPTLSAEMIFNSYIRIERRNGNYFNYLQTHEYHRNTPADGINVYSFSLSPEEFQPSGTANFSKLTQVTLNITYDSSISTLPDDLDATHYVFVTNYNILRFVGGMAGCAYIC